MKNQVIALFAALLISTFSFAQKDELKALKKIYDKEHLSEKDIADYKANLAKVESYLPTASEADKVYINYYKVQVPSLEFAMLLEKPENRANAPALFMKAYSLDILTDMAQAYNTVLAYEKKTGKQVFTQDIQEEFQAVVPYLQSYAGALDQQKNYKDVARLLYAMYLLNTSNQEMLFNAASYAYAGQENDMALKFYNELKGLNYSGEGTSYIARNLASEKDEPFATKEERDRMISLKTHALPREEKIASKRGEIYKNIALILAAKGQVDEAKAAIAAAQRENPGDTSLLLTEADLYLQLKDMENYKRLIAQVLEKNPDNADLVFNLGVIALQAEQLADAEKYFKRTTEVDPKYVNAYINLTATKLRADKKIVDEMNKLTTSEKDNKRYDALKKEREALFKSVLPYLDKAYELEPANQDVIANLISVYKFLEMTDTAKYKELKAAQAK